MGYCGSDYQRIFCWAHTHRNISDKLKSVKNVDHRKEILSDIVQIQSLPTEDTFRKAISLFFIKWANMSADVETFLEYFRNEKIEKHGAWYEAVKTGHWCPTNSNGIECFNRLIKDQQTFRERWPLGRFTGRILEMVHNWSYERDSETNPNAKIFHTVPVIDLKLWKQAYAFVKVL